MRLTPSTDLDNIKHRVGIGDVESLHISERRRSFLERFARVQAMNPDLSLRIEGKVAFISMDDEDEREIVIPESIDQTVTDIEKPVWMLLAQETLTMHEVGHDLYSDWPSIEDFLGEVDTQWFSVAKNMFNLLEDVAIEHQLGWEFDIEGDFRILNANMSEFSKNNLCQIYKDGDDEFHEYTFISAVYQAIIDEGLWDTGRTSRIMGPYDDQYGLYADGDQLMFNRFHPRIEQVVEDVKGEPDPVRRAQLIYLFWKDLADRLERSQVSGKHNSHNVKIPNHQDLGDSVGPGEMMPRPNDGIEEVSPSGGTGGGSGSSTPLPDPEEVAEEKRERLSEEFDTSIGESVSDELETLLEMISHEDAGIEQIQMSDPTQLDSKLWREAKRLGERLTIILEDKLRQSKRTLPARHRQTGRFDTTRMIAASRGSPYIFERDRDGTEKDYSCTIVLDRSGSMGAQKTRNAVVATGGWLYALENLGIDTMVLEFFKGSLQIAKPFGGEVDVFKQTLFHDLSGGGTPLGRALALTKERIGFGAGTHPFCVVITDGQAGNVSRYEKELRECKFPVMGVYLRPDIPSASSNKAQDTRASMDYFHRSVLVTKEDNLSETLVSLTSSIFI